MKNWLRSIEYSKDKWHLYILFLSAPVLLTLYRYEGTASRLAGYFGIHDFNNSTRQNTFYIYQHLFFFCFLFLLPVFYLLFFRQESLRDYGFLMGDWKSGFKIVLFSIPIIVLISYLSSNQLDFRAEYPLAKSLISHHEYILPFELAYIIFYYIAWEFFFRGFILFGLKAELGAVSAVLIQTISSCLVHIGKPESEIFSSMLAGIIFGAIALRTKSFWYTFIIHALLGVSLDLFIIFK
ncbi:MAG: CPBP family intramembrane glutamic endopeptidase [Saprospiraceae bacterium]